MKTRSMLGSTRSGSSSGGTAIITEMAAEDVNSKDGNHNGEGGGMDVSVSATDSSSSSSSSSSGSGSDSEEDNNFDDTTSSSTSASASTSTTGVRRRRGRASGGNTAVTVDDDDNAVIDVSNAKANANANPLYTTSRWIEFMIGSFIFFAALPLVVIQIVSCTIWEILDQKTFKITTLATKLNESIANWPTLKRLVHHPKDTFIINTTIWLGFVLPSYFFYDAFCQYQSITNGNGFIWWRASIYNIIRIGPMYRHFMFVYVLCHKEAHSYGRLFSEPHNTWLGLRFIYNYYIGFFHGVLPGPFTESHIYNHHKYDNSIDDVYSTGAYPRDSFIEFLRYVYVWFLYALNISSVRKFYSESKMERVYRSIGGTIYYVAGVTLAWKYVGSQFATFYILYPLVEGNILLSAVNYTWHAFIDPTNHDNDYVNSVTILDGLNFTLDEEYHVVHHQVRY
jgi:hypothetical protein